MKKKFFLVFIFNEEVNEESLLKTFIFLDIISGIGIKMIDSF